LFVVIWNYIYDARTYEYQIIRWLLVDFSESMVRAL